MINNYQLPLILEPQPEGGYTITCPIIPALITEADTLEEVLPNVVDCVNVLLDYDSAPIFNVLKPVSPQDTLKLDIVIEIKKPQ